MIKKILFPIFSIFLSYRTIELTKSLIISKPENYSNFQNLLFAFLLTLFITGVFAFIGFAYPSSRVLPNCYYKIRNPKLLKSISKILGVQYFRYLLLFTFWGKEKNRKKYFNGTKNGLKNFIYQTKQSEFGHIGAFVIIVVVSIIFIYHRYYILVLIMTLINIIGNLYPVILQRLHRERIEKIISRK